ncbi:MAG TPA: hypothetical protein VFZ65_18850 [Planctomycetota bacterium]|nr:hypothetical protein [Planctomycetota bacterium]
MQPVLSPSVLRSMVLVACAATAVPAQWYSLPLNAPQQVFAMNWYVAHDTGNGIVALSAIAQNWTTVSPAGSTMLRLADAVLLDREGPTTLRGWSAYSNSSATQTVSANINPVSNGASYVVVLDNAPATFGVLRAYSGFTNTWANLPLAQIPTFSLASASDGNVAVQQVGATYHAYSAYTGQWVTYTAAVAGAYTIVGPDYVAVDLHGTGGPRQYAAFSAQRGTWSVSPVYAAAGAAPVASQSANAFAIRADSGVATSFSYAGYSPLTGQWNTSSLVHTTGSTQTGTAFGSLVRIQDTDVNARFEIFGAANGIWQSLTGPNLMEAGLREEYQVVKDSTLTSSTVYAASALVGGGYTSITVPTYYPGVSQGSHGCLVFGGSSPATNAAWGYSAMTNTFTAPVAQPDASGVSQASGGAVAGFNVQGSSAYGTHAEAYTARWGTWVPGPAIGPAESWNTYAGTSLLLTERSLFPGYDLYVFDEHRNAWLPPVTTSATGFTVGRQCAIYHEGGTYHAYSSQRGVWSAQSGIGTITSAGGFVNVLDNLAWFTDSNNLIWVFAAPDRTQSWFQGPLSSHFASSGATPGGTTPYVGVSVKGGPTQYGLLYASLTLPPAPIAIPGLGGSLDLGVPGLVQIADLGLFDADGVREVRFAFPAVVPPGTQLWMQAVAVDLLSFQIDLLGRSTGSVFF